VIFQYKHMFCSRTHNVRTCRAFAQTGVSSGQATGVTLWGGGGGEGSWRFYYTGLGLVLNSFLVPQCVIAAGLRFKQYILYVSKPNSQTVGTNAYKITLFDLAICDFLTSSCRMLRH
jgi:hypothetical protein